MNKIRLVLLLIGLSCFTMISCIMITLGILNSRFEFVVFGVIYFVLMFVGHLNKILEEVN
jgi:hypothetical protein